MCKTDRISLIMPVYNAEHCLKRSVESVLGQTYTDFELILVDDCSTDKSGELCDAYAKADARIKVLHQASNAGPGPARNAALKIVQGEYIQFIDCDDFIDAQMLERMHAEICDSGCDLVIDGYHQDFLDAEDRFAYGVEVLPPVMEAATNKDCIASLPMLDAAKVLAVSPNKIYRACVILDNGVQFPSRMHSEDYFFIIDLFRYIRSFKTVSYAFYHYLKYQRETLTNMSYLKGFSELINERFSTQRKLLSENGAYSGEARNLMCSVHIKHVFSAAANECSPASGLSSRARRERIKALLRHENTQEAKKYAIANSKMQAIMNIVVKINSPLLFGLAAKLIYLTQHRASRLFHKMKIK